MKKLGENFRSKLTAGNLILTAIVLAFVILVPQLTSGYMLKVINVSMDNAILALSLMIMLSMVGTLSFSFMAFMGVGAGLVAGLTTGQFGITIENTLLTLLISMVLTGLIAFVVGMILNRLSGTFFTFATLGFVSVMSCVFSQTNFMGGSYGITGVPKLNLFGLVLNNQKKWFYFMIVIICLCSLFISRLRTSKLGRSLNAIKSSPTLAVTLGVNVVMAKVYAFTIQAVMAALAGGLYVYINGFIGNSIFSVNAATNVVIMVMTGGFNSIFGVIVGSFLITVLPELLRSMQSYLNVIFGVIVIVTMIICPTGIAGFVQNMRLNANLKKEARKGMEAAK